MNKNEIHQNQRKNMKFNHHKIEDLTEFLGFPNNEVHHHSDDEELLSFEREPKII